jgi:hypothetical protein
LKTVFCGAFEPDASTDVVIDRTTVAQTAIEGPRWFEEDFESAEEEEKGDEQSDDEQPAPLATNPTKVRVEERRGATKNRAKRQILGTQYSVLGHPQLARYFPALAIFTPREVAA